MRHPHAEATRLGHRAVVYGHPDYYPRFGFKRGAEVGVAAPGGATFDALMALAPVDDGLDGVGAAGADALRAALRGHGIRWGTA